MLSLLTLPQEIRDNIIDFCLAEHSVALPHDIDEERRRRHRCKRVEYSSWVTLQHEDDNILYLTDPIAHRSGALGLLLTNLQLKAETQQRVQRTPTIVAVDIKMNSSMEIWPTWTNLPPNKTTHIDILHATFTLWGSPFDTVSDAAKRILWNYTTGQSNIAWSFFNVLQRFLFVGPMVPLPPSRDGSAGTDRKKYHFGPEPGSYTDRGFIVKSLEIDIKEPIVSIGHVDISPVQYDTNHGKSRGGVVPVDKDISPDRQLMPTAEDMARSVKSHITRLLIDYADTHANIVWRRVGQIKIIFDGQVLEVNMQKHLHDIYLNAVQDTVASWLTPKPRLDWVHETMRVRDQFGFPPAGSDPVK